jgi:2-C-methyl-D-erythritol 4-phosphate cytidylyltransferase
VLVVHPKRYAEFNVGHWLWNNESFPKWRRKALNKWSKSGKIIVCKGDKNERQQSLINGINALEQSVKLKPQDVIITHDAARPFPYQYLIDHHIKNTKRFGYSTTLYKINDSLCELNKTIKYLDRQNKYLVQTPQSLLYKNWRTTKIDKTATDLFTYLKVTLKEDHVIEGNWRNFKITTFADLKTLGVQQSGRKQAKKYIEEFAKKISEHYDKTNH